MRRRRARPRCACGSTPARSRKRTTSAASPISSSIWRSTASTHVARGRVRPPARAARPAGSAPTPMPAPSSPRPSTSSICPRATPATLDEACSCCARWRARSSFAPAAIDRERGIIQSEERTRATPGYRIFVDQLGYLLRGQLLPQRIPIGMPEVIAQRPARALRRLLRRLLPARARDPDRGRRFRPRRDGGARSAPASATGSGRGPAGRRSRSRRGRAARAPRRG